MAKCMLKYTASLLAALTLSWSCVSMASLPPDSGASQDLQSIAQWTTALNGEFPQLNLTVYADTTTAQGRQAVLNDLQLLDAYLAGQVQLQRGALVHLACKGIVCDGQ